MAQSTTIVNACDAVIQVDNGSGTLTDISGSSNQVQLSFTINVGENTTFDGDYAVRKVCGKDASADLTVLYSVTANEGADIVEDWYHTSDGASRTLQIDVPDSSVGSKRYSGEFILSEYGLSLDSGEGGPITLDASMMSDGAVTYTTIAS